MVTIKVDIVWDENFGAVSDQIPGCVATHHTLEGVKNSYVSAVQFHLEGLQPDEIPECLKGEYQFEYVLSVQALLHYYDGIITRSTLSRVTGINQRQLGHYLSGYRHPRKDKRQRIIEGLHQIGKELQSIS